MAKNRKELEKILRQHPLHATYTVDKILLRDFGMETLTVWKKAYHTRQDGSRVHVLVELELQHGAQFVTHPREAKCRADKALVKSITCIDHMTTGFPRQTKEHVQTAVSGHDPKFTYTVGKMVKPRRAFNKHASNVCSSGIHFFFTKQRAMNYV